MQEKQDKALFSLRGFDFKFELAITVCLHRVTHKAFLSTGRMCLFGCAQEGAVKACTKKKEKKEFKRLIRAMQVWTVPF